MSISPTRIAVVDDDAAVRKALARLLIANGFQTETFASAQNFLDSLTERRPDCVVADLQMPEMTGLELLLHLGARTPVPMIIMTAFNEAGLRERCAAAGARAYLVKPLRGQALVSAIVDALGGSMTPAGTHSVAVTPPST